MPWAMVGGRFGWYSRCDLLDMDIDPDEGREPEDVEPDEDPDDDTDEGDDDA